MKLDYSMEIIVKYWFLNFGFDQLGKNHSNIGGWQELETQHDFAEISALKNSQLLRDNYEFLLFFSKVLKSELTTLYSKIG